MIPQLMMLCIATNLLFIISAHCSDAYTTSVPTTSSITSKHNRHHPNFRWQTSSTTSSLSSTSTSSDNEEENITTRDLLSLEYIRSTLIRQEETIIFALIERSQFRQNDICYVPGGVPGLGVPPGSNVEDESEEDFSFLDFMFTGTEALHSIVRRYESPEEHAFFPSRLPKRSNSLSELDYPNLLSNDEAINDLNWNTILTEKYLNVIVPSIANKGDDEQHGSTVLCDIAALQALSKRIHFGKFVAESKYQSNPSGFQKLVDDGDADGVMELLTNAKVEEQVLTRARLKATTYGREPLMASMPKVEGNDDDNASIIAAAAASAVVTAMEAMKKSDDDDTQIKGKVDPVVIESIYRELIIPMTKDIEVAYLFLRCGREPPVEYASDRMSVDVTELSL